MKKVHIIFSPHLDDAVFSIGGFIAKNAPSVVVVTFFAGKPPIPIRPLWDRLCGFKNSSIAIDARLIENNTALSILNLPLENVVNLSYLDIQYRIALKMNHPHHTLQLKESIYAAMENVLQKYTGSAVAVYGPSMKLHPDHAIIHEAYTKLATNFKQDTHTSFYLFQDLPYSYYAYVKRRFTKVSSSIEKIITSLPVRTGDKSTSYAIDTVPLSVGEFANKIKAINAYKSQFVGFHKSLLWIISHFSKLQAKVFTPGSSHSEILYEIKSRQC